MEDTSSCFLGGLCSLSMHQSRRFLVDVSVRNPVMGGYCMHRYGQNQCRISLVSLFKVFTLLCLYRFACGSQYKVMDEMGSVKALKPRSLNGSRRSLDGILQEYAFRAFVRPRTGIIYDAQVPANLSGIEVEAVRLKSGSLWNRGILYNEFQIPKGVLEQPYVERLALVYHNLGNWSSVYYNRPGFVLVAPVLGLLAYDASNLSAINLKELDFVATKQPISIRFTDVMLPEGLTPICIFFYLNGSVSLGNVTSPNVCSTMYQGHFSLIVESLAPSLAPSPAPISGIVPPSAVTSPNIAPAPIISAPAKKGKSNTWKIALGSVFGSIIVLALLGFVGYGLLKYGQKSKIEKMEHQADQGEALQMALVGSSRAPAAAGTRTQPKLENEYVA